MGEKGGERERLPLASCWQSRRRLSSRRRADSGSILPSLELPPRTSRESLPRGLPRRLGWPLRARGAVRLLRTDPRRAEADGEGKRQAPRSAPVRAGRGAARGRNASRSSHSPTLRGEALARGQWRGAPARPIGERGAEELAARGPPSPAASSGPARSFAAHAVWRGRSPPGPPARPALRTGPAGGRRGPGAARAGASPASSAAASPGPAGTPGGEREARPRLGEAAGKPRGRSARSGAEATAERAQAASPAWVAAALGLPSFRPPARPPAGLLLLSSASPPPLQVPPLRQPASVLPGARLPPHRAGREGGKEGGLRAALRQPAPPRACPLPTRSLTRGRLGGGARELPPRPVGCAPAPAARSGRAPRAAEGLRRCLSVRRRGGASQPTDTHTHTPAAQ